MPVSAFHQNQSIFGPTDRPTDRQSRPSQACLLPEAVIPGHGIDNKSKWDVSHITLNLAGLQLSNELTRSPITKYRITDVERIY